MKQQTFLAILVAAFYAFISIRVVQLYPEYGEVQWTIFGNEQYASWWLKGGVASSGILIGSLIGLIDERRIRRVFVQVGVWYGCFDIVMYWTTQDQYGMSDWYWNVGATIVAGIYTYIKLREK